MNFLAHLLLGPHDDESLAGSVLADFVRGRLEGRFAPRMEQAIRLHRFIDDFTDDNPHWKRSRERLSSERRRYAGVLVDVFYDHFVSVFWDELARGVGDRERFIRRSYRALARHQGTALDVAGGVERIGWLVEEDWLGRYASLEGLAHTFRGLSRRTRRSGVMAGAEVELFAAITDFAEDFHLFWPELVEAVAREGERLEATA